MSALKFQNLFNVLGFFVIHCEIYKQFQGKNGF